MCCHGCQALRASTAVLGIELGGHHTLRMLQTDSEGPCVPYFFQFCHCCLIEEVLFVSGWRSKEKKKTWMWCISCRLSVCVCASQWWVNSLLTLTLLYFFTVIVTASFLIVVLLYSLHCMTVMMTVQDGYLLPRSQPELEWARANVGQVRAGTDGLFSTWEWLSD